VSGLVTLIWGSHHGRARRGHQGESRKGNGKLTQKRGTRNDISFQRKSQTLTGRGGHGQGNNRNLSGKQNQKREGKINGKRREKRKTRLLRAPIGNLGGKTAAAEKHNGLCQKIQRQTGRKEVWIKNRSRGTQAYTSRRFTSGDCGRGGKRWCKDSQGFFLAGETRRKQGETVKEKTSPDETHRLFWEKKYEKGTDYL